MFQNYLKVAWRHLQRNKGLSFINIFGLAIGIAFAILIGLWIKYETSFDKFHKNGDRIALIYKHTFFNNERNTQEAVPLPLYYELKSSYPEVKRITRLDWNNTYSLVVGDKKFKKTGSFVDPDYLDMFTFKIVKGNSSTALNDIHSFVITESLANVLFGNNDPIGKIIRVNNNFDMKVTAVIQDPPKNSTLQFDFLAPYDFLVSTSQFMQDSKTDWGNNFLRTAIELKEGTSMTAFSKKIANLNIERDKRLKDLTLFLHPLSKWNLQSEYRNWINTSGKLAYVKLFGLVGIFVLLIACINFMNLSTARSEKRAREVGIRKAIGSGRKQLIVQFLTETLLTSFFAFILALGIIPLVLPFLKELGFQNIVFDLTNLPLMLSVLGIALLTGLIAGSYPAMYLSSFLPVKVLKGLFKQGQGAVTFRRVLVVSQFAISVGLIIVTAIVFKQINFARERSLGYQKNNLINVTGSEDLFKNFNALKNELQETGYLEAIAKTSGPLTAIYNSWSDFEWTGKDPNSQTALDVIMTEWDFEKTAGFKFLKGRPFSRNYKTDSNAIILSNAALKMINYNDPIGKTIKMGDRNLAIVGVIDDVIISDPYKPVRPLVIMFDAGSATNSVYMRLKPSVPVSKIIAAIQPIFEKYNPAYPFEFGFSDEEFDRKFTMEKQVGQLAAIFAGLAVFISCLGLFGLAAFMTDRRTKEIGIRKVLGASLVNIWSLLSREFVWLVLAGCVIASPIAFFLMNDWLSGYDYRIRIDAGIFVVAGGIALAVALLTVSSQAIKAAISNPVKSLRSE